MDLPNTNLIPIKTSDHLSFPCLHCDPDLIHKIAQLLLPALATAIIDSFATDFFLTRKEMINYLIQQTQTLIPNLLLSHQSPPNPNPNPIDIISDLISDFTFSKRSIFSWIFSNTREEKIDDLIHEMDANLFWTMDRREAISEELLRNLDYKNEWHCAMRFGDERELEEHGEGCGFRPVRCGNEGCKVKYCKMRELEHDGICGYKVLGCEQGCGELVVRREMDRHCVTVCGMKLMNCPFYQVGCETGIARCRVEEHCRDELRRHLVCVMKIVYGDEEISDDVCEARAKAVEAVIVFLLGGLCHAFLFT